MRTGEAAPHERLLSVARELGGRAAEPGETAPLGCSVKWSQ